MNAGALFIRLIFAQVVLGVIAFGVADHSAALVLAAGSLAVLSWYIVEGPRGRPLPRWLITAGVIVATGWTIWRQVRGAPLIISLGEYIVYLQLFKLYDRKRNRDYAQLMVLSLMQMVCAAIISAEIVFAVLLAAYLALALLSAMVFQLKLGLDEVAQAAVAQAPAGVEPIRPRSAFSGEPRRSLRRVAAGAGASIVVVSVAFFLLLPRGELAQGFGAWKPPNRRAATTGFTEQVQLTSGMQISASRTPVMNVRVLKDGQDIGSMGRTFLLRGMALDRYHAGEHRWSRGTALQSYDRALALSMDGQRVATVLVPEAGRSIIRQEVRLREGTDGVMFTVFPSTAVQFTGPGTVYFNPIDQVVRMARGDHAGLEYAVESLDLRGADLTEGYIGAPSLDDTRPLRPGSEYSWSSYARRPVLTDPRLRELAERIMQAKGLTRDPANISDLADQRIAAAIEGYLGSTYRYTLDLPPMATEQDPILGFLFEHKVGHCEYFASAMAALLRSVGIRARMISGFVAGEYNSVGGYYVVREMNAHAWVEAWTQPGGWRSFDPSPAAAIHSLHQPGAGVLGSLRDFYEYLEFHWINSVITYDENQRRGIISSVTSTLELAAMAFGSTVGEAAEAVAGAYEAIGPAGPLAVGAVAAAMLAGVIRRRWRRGAGTAARTTTRGTAGTAAPRVVAFYIDALRTLERLGFRKPAWQTPMAFAHDVHRRDARLAPVIELTRLFYEVRFGDRPLDADRQRAVQAHLEALRRAGAATASPAAR